MNILKIIDYIKGVFNLIKLINKASSDFNETVKHIEESVEIKKEIKKEMKNCGPGKFVEIEINHKEEYKKIKRQTEQKIADFAKVELSDFIQKTGFHPSDIEFLISDVTTIDSDQKEILISGVKLTVEL